MSARRQEFRSHWHDASGRTTTDVLVRRTKLGSKQRFFLARASCGQRTVLGYGETAVQAFNRIRNRLGLPSVPKSGLRRLSRLFPTFVDDRSMWDEPFCPRDLRGLAKDMERQDAIARRLRLALPLEKRINVLVIRPKRRMTR